MPTISSGQAKRLQDLQMADLGTARRDYISTVDDPKKLSKAQLAEIEALRQSNIAGTAAARLAKQNQARLTEWSNLHRSIGDTKALEALGDLMSGQSHRANLNAVVQAAGGQRYSDDQKKRGTGSKKNHPNPSSSSGRGGGVVGTCGRGALGSSPKLAKHKRDDSPKWLDPALNINNSDSPQRGRGSHRGHGKRGQGRREDASPRSSKEVPVGRKRPAGAMDYTRNLSTPEAFMAAARKKLVSPAATEAPQSSARRPVSSSPSRPPSSPDRRVPPPPRHDLPLAQRVSLLPGRDPAPAQRVSLPPRHDPALAQRVPSPPPPRPLPASGVLLDIDAPEASPSTNVKEVLVSPGCAELTGLDFPPSEPSPSLGTNTHGQQIPMLRKLVDTTRLTQQLVEEVRDVRDSVASSIISALDDFQEKALAPVTDYRGTASSDGWRVQHWLSQTPAGLPMSSQRTFNETRKSSFLEYRSPENTSTSSNSAPQELPTTGLLLSPRRSVASEAMIPFEELQLSESPRRPPSLSTRASNSLDQSIHAAPWPRGHRLGEARVIGVRPSMDKKLQSRLVTEFEGSGIVRGSSLAARHAGRSWSAASLSITPVTEGQLPRIGQASTPAAPPGLPQFSPNEPKPRPTITAQPPMSRGLAGVKVIGPAPSLPNYPVARDLTNFDQATGNMPASSDTRAENKAPPKVRTIGPQAFVKRT